MRWPAVKKSNPERTFKESQLLSGNKVKTRPNNLGYLAPHFKNQKRKRGPTAGVPRATTPKRLRMAPASSATVNCLRETPEEPETAATYREYRMISTDASPSARLQRGNVSKTRAIGPKKETKKGQSHAANADEPALPLSDLPHASAATRIPGPSPAGAQRPAEKEKAPETGYYPVFRSQTADKPHTHTPRHPLDTP